MKNVLVLTVIFCMLVIPCFTAGASEKFTCDDLTELANDLDDIAVAFDEAGVIREGDDIDVALGEIVDALIMVAEIENEDTMYNAVDSLVDAYNRMDGERFGLSLDSVILNLDRLYRRDCN